MAQQPRGRPPSQAPPPGRGRNMLTALGGGVLVLAVAGGAWVLFGRDDDKAPTSAIGPKVPSSSPTTPVFGPVAPGQATKPSVGATSTSPVATPKATAKAVATTSPTPAPTKAAAATTAPTAAPTAKPTPKPSATTASPAPVPVPPVTKPPVSAPQQTGTVAKKDYTFKVARGDTLWDLTTKVLSATGRSTSNASVAAFVTELYQSNKAVIGADPDLILPGQTIVWPTGL